MARRPFDGPVRITQEYGVRNSMYRKGYHTGVDYGLPSGHPLVAPTAGTISSGYEGSTTNGRGWYVIIKGNDGVTHHLYHMKDEPLIRTGTVTEGQRIGFVGSTGASTGPHLHWETRRNDVDFAPGSWLFAGQPVYIPTAPVYTEYVRIFGDFRTIYQTPLGTELGRLAPNKYGGHLDYAVLARSGTYVKIKSASFGLGWIYCGKTVAHLTQFYVK